MIFDSKVRLAYWFVSHIGHCGPQSVSDFYELKFRRVGLGRIRQVLSPLVSAGALVRSEGRSKKYDLARPADQIALFDIYKAFNPKWDWETLSVAVMVEKILSQLYLSDLLKFEETEIQHIMMRIRL